MPHDERRESLQAAPTSAKALRLWPGVTIAIVVVIARYLVPAVAPDDLELFSLPLAVVGVFVSIFGALAILLWWLLLSRAPWLERVGALILIVVVEMALRPLVDKSITGGMMGNMLFVYSIPVLALALVAWAVATRHLSTCARRASLVAAMVLAAVPFTLIRSAGVHGVGADLHWRWTPTPEDRLLARGEDPAPSATTPADEKPRDSVPAEPRLSAPAPAAAKREPAPRAATTTAAEWPGFRGANRDGVVPGVRIETGWSQSPPVEMWRKPIGPGWSSFAVRGDLLYTQEQRGEEEIVACYRVSTGDPVWRHRDPVRFWESNGGAGPRGTPTIHGDRVYAFGATGILNALGAATGKVVWSRDVAKHTGRSVPYWGFSSSPLVIDDLVIIAASGTLAAYDIATGAPRWVGPRQLASYSSPHRATIDGVEQVLLLTGSGASAFAPATGAMLWQHEWTEGTAPIVQPAFTADGDILINTIVATGGVGIRRLAVTQQAGGWKVEEKWTSRGLKPYFNDFVVHNGHAFGFDGSILSCINLEDGARTWKGGRYGNGQLVLLAEQDLLLVISEDGELALVAAAADRFTELARFPALEGKTWNHPVLVRDLLLVRNGGEMAAFRLPLAHSETTRP